MPGFPGPDHPWRPKKTSYGMRPKPAALNAAEVHAAKTSFAAGFKKASIARMLNVSADTITAALKPGYRPFKES